SNHRNTLHVQLIAFPVNSIMKTEITNSNVDPAVDSHSDIICCMINTSVYYKFSGTDVFDQWFGRTICYSIMILVFKNYQVHSSGFSSIFRENSMKNKYLIAHCDNSTRIINLHKLRM